MKRICVFCGSSNGHSPQFKLLADRLGTMLAEKKIGLVYGGGNVGLMGAVANAALAGGTEVIGVIPKHLQTREMAHFQITQLHVVEDMHERKRLMYDFSDAFVIIPGGMGTLDEMFEILTWAQLGLHSKPIYLLNIFGFYDHLILFLKHSHESGFIKDQHINLINVIEDIETFSEIIN
jgi:uncharacterized protein (TIGR00730 family)